MVDELIPIKEKELYKNLKLIQRKTKSQDGFFFFFYSQV